MFFRLRGYFFMKKIFVRLFACLIGFVCLFPFSSCQKRAKDRSRYEITAEYRDDVRMIAGTVKVEFFNAYEKEISSLKFHLYPNAYRKNAIYKPISESEQGVAYYAGESYGDATITSVAGVKSWTVCGEDENILSVELLRPLAKESKTTVDISFVVELAKVNHFTGATAHTVNFGNFFPILCAYKNGEFVEHTYTPFGNPFNSEYADYVVHFTSPSEYAVSASAIGTVVKGLESKTKYTFELKTARDFALALSKEFKTVETTQNNTQIRYCYYDDKDAKSHLDFLSSVFLYFEKTFGEYPYPGLCVAQTGLTRAESAYPGLIMLSDSLGEEECKRALARGLARQWWSEIAGSDSVLEAWISESLAEYSAVAFFEENPDFGIKKDEIVKKSLQEYRSYFSVYGSVFGGVDTRMSRALKEFSSGYEYQRLAVDKGVILWDTLRKSIGDGKFFQGLKNYYKTGKFRISSKKELIEAFEKTGISVEGFFDSFLSGKAVL